jgi:ComF family protein
MKQDLEETGFDVIVPVPLHRARLAERGYNQAHELARGIAGTIAAKSVRRIRPTPSQTGLHVEERIENVRGAFALTRSSRSLEGKHVLIVDDVMTTGATITSVAETLLAAKPRAISIATLAVTEHPEEPPEREEVRHREADFF